MAPLITQLIALLIALQIPGVTSECTRSCYVTALLMALQISGVTAECTRNRYVNGMVNRASGRMADCIEDRAAYPKGHL